MASGWRYIVSYSESLLVRVERLIDRGFGLMCATCNDFKEFDLNEAALRSLKEKKQRYPFRSFS